MPFYRRFCLFLRQEYLIDTDAMKYDAIINRQRRLSLTYAELIALPLTPDTLVRRDSGEGWMRASECVELTHVIASSAHSRVTSQKSPPPVLR